MVGTHENAVAFLTGTTYRNHRNAPIECALDPDAPFWVSIAVDVFMIILPDPGSEHDPKCRDIYPSGELYSRQSLTGQFSRKYRSKSG